jgi:hypothetical protein
MKKIAGIVVFLSAVFFFAVSMFMSGAHRNFADEEMLIEKITPRIESKYVFRTYPAAPQPLCERDKSGVMRLMFPDGREKRYEGISLFLSLWLQPCRENGRFEFLVKSEIPYAATLEVYLWEGGGKKALFRKDVPIELSGKWQKVSIPLREFQQPAQTIPCFGNAPMPSEGKIQDIVFSLTCPQEVYPAVILIDAMKILDNDGNTAYDLSYDI